MNSHNNSPAALRRTAIVFASLCCSATAIGAAAPLFASSSDLSVATSHSIVTGGTTIAHAARDSKDA
ncbi:hypothetical protein OMW55_02815 [Sphingomonas sp. BN140010]|uniref:Uncharacterized protein n=1 Tax=Sphingomonas arvum TaxID=2992113 RepID=A0ABT3JCI2_9SPHN|nr:hypothetical protein [Sphingomonas sp. BN140010]MCW3796739.1 hypothetical protein [Sphingomonas sp. BN140010]